MERHKSYEDLVNQVEILTAKNKELVEENQRLQKGFINIESLSLKPERKEYNCEKEDLEYLTALKNVFETLKEYVDQGVNFENQLDLERALSECFWV